MTTLPPSTQRMSREDFKKARELEELRKSGAAPPELDDEGNMINPHIPQYISQAPWYLSQNTRPGLKHQKASMFQKDTPSANETPLGTFTQHYQRGARPSADTSKLKYQPGACTNCGATTHKTKDCCERPRAKGAALTGQNIAPPETIQQLEFTYEGKRDRYNGYDTKDYAKVIKRFEVTELARKQKKLKELDEAFQAEAKRLKEEEEKAAADAAAGITAPTADSTADSTVDATVAVSSSSSSTTAVSSIPVAAASSSAAASSAAVVPGEGLAADATDARRLRALKKQAKLKKMIKKAQKAASANNTAASSKSGDHDSDSDSDSDGSDTDDDDDMRDLGEVHQKKDSNARMTVRNLRLREDTAKYLRNLDLNSAHFDPKTRSLRDNPYNNKNPNEVMYAGDNFVRKQGDVKEIQQLQSFVWEAQERGNEELHVQALPSQAEKMFAEYKKKKEALAQARKSAILDKYATTIPGAASGVAPSSAKPKELSVPVNEAYVEYDSTGTVLRGIEHAAPKTKYLEDVRENGHKSVWGSYYVPASGGGIGRWGYACCHQIIRHAICTGEAGKQASLGMKQEMEQRTQAKEQTMQKDSLIASHATAAAAAAPSSSSSSHIDSKSSIIPPHASSSTSTAMDTTADTKSAAAKSVKRKRHSHSRSRSRSSSSSSSSSRSSSSDPSSSSSGSDSDSSMSGSDSDSDSSSRRRSKKSESKSKSKSKKGKKKKKSSFSSSSKSHAKKKVKIEEEAKNSKGYNTISSSARDVEPSQAQMDEYYRSKIASDDPLMNMPKDTLLEK